NIKTIMNKNHFLSISRSQSTFFRLEKTDLGTMEVFDYPSISDDEIKFVILLTPGNPGVIQIYEKFLKSLYLSFNKKVRVIGVGHLGHSKYDHNNKKIFTVNQQIEKSVVFIRKLAKDNKTKIILFGHSLGSYININVVKEHPEFPVIYMIHLFPVLCKLNIPFSVRLISMPYFRKIVSSVVSSLPQTTKLKGIKLFSYSAQEAELAVAYSSNDHFLENILAMGDEFIGMLEEGLPDDIVSSIKETKDKALFVHTTLDRYVTPKVFKYIQSTIGFGSLIKQIKQNSL
ncbi:hypothetical protein MHBO_001898, partial [Bonamia ostreae]